MTDFMCVCACSSMRYLDSLSYFAFAKKQGPARYYGLIVPILYLSVLTLNPTHHNHSVSLNIQLISV